MKKIVLLGALLLAMGQAYANDANFFTAANSFFNKYVNNGAVAYAKIKANGTDLAQLTRQIADFELNRADKNTKIAFMINAYNILAIKGIVDNYPTKGPMSINNFFDAKNYTVNRQTVSLNQLEKQMLYPLAKDPRLHFVLVCAAKSCPKLASFAYTPAKIESQLEAQTKLALNDAAFIRTGANKLEVSEIFNWYQADFTKGGKTVKQYINQYLTNKAGAGTQVTSYTYNWALNDQ